MKKKIFAVIAVVAIAAIAGWNISQSKSDNVLLSDIALANVEALADDENAFCSSCGPCTGSYVICFSQYDWFWENISRNCGSLDITLTIINC